MGGGRGGKRAVEAPPIPLEPVDLLAGLGPGVELVADEVPEDVPVDGGLEDAAVVTVTEVGKLLRQGEPTVRRLIRTPEIAADGKGDPAAYEATMVPRSRQRPSE